MTLEVRPVTPDEMDEMRRIAGFALGAPKEAFRATRPEWTLCVFEDGRMTTTLGAFPFVMCFNGAELPVSGVTNVGTVPVHRRRGHLRRAMTVHFEKLHEEGVRPIAILHASWAGIYQRFGYGVVTTDHRYLLEPRFLHFSPPRRVPGGLREGSREDLSTLVALYRRFRAPRTGYLHRSGPRWQEGILKPRSEKAFLGIHIYEEEGQPLGYVVYATEEVEHSPDQSPGGWQRLGIRDLAWLNPAAYRAIWECFGHMDAVREIVWWGAPADDPLPHLLAEPRMLRATAHDGILARLVDVDKALAVRHYGIEATLTFAVSDELCGWNAGCWQLATSGAETRVTRTTRAPQVTLPVSTLAMLAFGQISATEAERMGRLAVEDRAALPLWDAAFRTDYRPHCPDGF